MTPTQKFAHFVKDFYQDDPAGHARYLYRLAKEAIREEGVGCEEHQTHLECLRARTDRDPNMSIGPITTTACRISYSR